MTGLTTGEEVLGMTTVLVVDDDTELRESLRMVLEDAGYDALEAAGGAAALNVLRASKERLVVLLDLIMPLMDGIEVLRAVAADSMLATRHTYILLTADDRPMAAANVALLASLGVPTVHKPVDIDDLLAAVTLAEQRI